MNIPNTCEENAVLQTKILLQLAYALGGDDAQIDLGAGVISPLQAQITINSDKIFVNISAISSLSTTVDDNKTLLDDVDIALSNQISTLSTTLSTSISQNEILSSEADTALDSRITESSELITNLSNQIASDSDGFTIAIKGIADEIDIIKGNVQTNGSIKHAVNIEELRAKSAELVFSYDIATIVDILNDTTDANNETIKGLVSRVNDLETALNSLQNT